LRKALLALAAVVGLALAVHAGVGAWGRAQVEGSTSEARIRSICRLADLQPRGAGEAVARAAAEEADVTVRRAAVVALARFGKPKYRPVVEACTRDAEAGVRASAATTLGAYSDAASADRLGEILASEAEAEVRLGAVAGLVRSEHPRAVVWLLETVQNDANARVQAAAIAALYGKFGMEYVGAAPDGTARWQRELQFRAEWLKDFAEVQEAYAEAGRALEERPEYYQPPIDEPDPRAGG